MTPVGIVGAVLAACAFTAGLSAAVPYYGTRIGKFSTHFHGVKGDVYAVDDRTIFIQNFKYDGKGPDTFFWAGTSIRPDPSGFIIADERGTNDVLSAYNGQDLVLRLPEGKRVQDLRWLAVWCKKFRANFGSLIFPKVLQPPSPILIGPLENTRHGVSSGNIMILDTQTFLIHNFTYDGAGNDAHWWISRGLKPNTGGLRLLDENGSDEALKKHINNTVVISVPEGHSVYDYNTLSVWSTVDIVDYGSVKIPRDLVVPPSPRTLGISPESKLNCEMLNDNLGFEARWVINGDQLIIQLVGKIDVNEYMALGLSKDDTETKFTSADAAVAWLGDDGQGHAVDYFLQSTDKCEDGRGMCPDTVHNGGDNSITLLNTAKINDHVMVTFRRPLKAVDKQYDQHIYTDGPQAVLWAVGPILNQEAGPPKLRTRGNLLLDFGRDPIWNCPTPDEATLVAERSEHLTVSETIPKIHCPNDYTFRAQLGPSMKANAPERIWYINGIPSPDLIIQRGHTYTFIVEGGTNAPNHHPMYITSNSEGGLYQKVLEADPAGETVYAGVTHDPDSGTLLPTAEGRLCNWSVPENGPEYSLLTSARLSQPALVLSCAQGNAGKLLWTPDANTSELVYYQSFMGKNLGGRIKVMDFCEESDPEHYIEEIQRRQDSQLKQHSKTGTILESALEREGDPTDTIYSLESSIQKPNDPIYTAEDDGQINTDEMFGLKSETGIDNEEEKGTISEINLDKVEQISQKIIFNPAEAEERIVNNFESTNEKQDSNFQTEIEKHIEFASSMPLENSDTKHNKDVFSLTQSTADPEASENVFSISSYPHDDSERLDLHIPHPSETQKSESSNNLQRRKVQVGAHNNHNEDSREHVHRPLHLSNEAQSKITKSPPGFNVQLEGGFVPLILNPSKGKESATNPDYVPPPPHLRKPHRPFLFNESIPFHGTFKPGVPDFSGFNISHYSQEGTIPDLNHVLDHQAMLSAPKPQIVQRPLSPMGGLPHELFRRPHGAHPRPQLFGYGPRPQMSLIPAQQQHMIVQLPSKHHGNFLITAPETDDLDEGSSQRVQISLQSPNEKNSQKSTAPNIPIRQTPGRDRPHGLLSHKVAEPNPPIQRRPDVVEDDDVNYRPSQQRPPHTKLHPPRFPNSGHHKNENQPLMPPQRRRPGIGRPLPFQRPPPVVHESAKDRRPPFPFHQRRPPPPQNLGRKPPPLFAQRPPVRNPQPIPNVIPNNPFQYRLPERPGTNIHLKSPQSTEDVSDNSRHPDSQKTNLQLDPSNLLPYLPSEEIVDDNSESYELIPVHSHDHNGQSMLINHDLMPSHDSSKYPPQIFIHRPPNTQEFQDHRPQVNFEHFYVGQPGEVTNIKSKVNNPSPSKPYLIRQQAPPESGELHLHKSQNIPEEIEIKQTENNKPSEESKIVITGNTAENSPTYSVVENHEVHLSSFGEQKGSEEIDYSNNPDHKNKPLDFHSGDRFISIPNLEDFELPTKQPASPVFIESNSANEPQKEAEVPFIHIPDEHIGENIEYVVHELDDYHDVPFGARLKTKVQEHQTGELKPVFNVAKAPVFYPSRRQPQFSSPPTKEVHYIETSTNKVVLQTMEPPRLYFIPPAEDKELFLKDRAQANKTKVPLTVAVDSEKISLATYPGRKNILPSDQGINYSPPNIPARAPENIILPHISENPPSHDNGTDYSILAHVLSLIGGQPQPFNIVSPRNKN